MSAPPTTTEVSAFLLELHECSNDRSHHEVQQLALRRFADLVPFDSGLLAMGTLQNGVPYGHDVVLHAVSLELMASWETVKHEDRVAQWAFTHPGQTANFVVAGPIFDGCDAMRAHCKRWHLAHVLCTCLIEPDAGLYWVMSTYRADPNAPFSEDERSVTQMLVKHIFSASRRARLMQLRGRARVVESQDQLTAIANDAGLVLEAEPGFAEMMRLGFEAWHGPLLPEAVRSMLATANGGRLAREGVVLRARPSSGVFVIDVRRTVVADTLTSREREIAEAFSLGETHREIGTRFDVAPNTVRRHLSNVYEKLGISSKVELERMLSGAW